jgi:uncharacterized membrane protein YtjA (UPF0391 family)
MRYTVIFLLFTLAAAIVAFGGFVTTRAVIARGVFVACIFLFLLSFMREASNPPQKQRKNIV